MAGTQVRRIHIPASQLITDSMASFPEQPGKPAPERQSQIII